MIYALLKFFHKRSFHSAKIRISRVVGNANKFCTHKLYVEQQQQQPFSNKCNVRNAHRMYF